MDGNASTGPLAADDWVEPSSLPGFIGPRVGWWHEQGDPGYSRDELLRLLPMDPYQDDEPVQDLDSASLLVQELDRYQADLNRAEAARMGGLVSAYRAVLRQAGDLGQSRAENGVPVRAFLLQVALAFQVSERTATTWLFTAVALAERAPRSWSRFLSGACSWRAMRILDEQGAGLDPDWWPAYDADAAPLLGRVPIGHLKQRLHSLRERLQADTAAARHRAANARRRVDIDALPDGMAALTITAAAAEIHAIGTGLRAGAVAAHGLPDETRGIGQLMTDIALDLLTEGMKTPPDDRRSALDDPDASGSDAARGPIRVPGRKGVAPQVTVLVPALTLLGRSDVPATLDGQGPIDLETARRLCAGAASWTRLLTHPVSGVRLELDATTYTPPAALRRYLAIRDGTCRAPGCTRPSVGCDLDHVHEWHEGGRTTACNLAFLCRRHHQIKGSTWWDTTMTRDAVQTWTSAWGTVHTTRPTDEPEATPFDADADSDSVDADGWYRPPETDENPPF